MATLPVVFDNVEKDEAQCSMKFLCEICGSTRLVGCFGA